MIAPEAGPAFNPFPGLRAFEPDEDYLFFGRDRLIDGLIHRLWTTRFLAVLGTSGSGKSSLVRSGLIPALQGGAMTRAGSSWRIAILRPGEDPIGNLAAALAAPEVLGRGEDREVQRAFFETTLRASKQGLVECVRQARLPARDNLLVLVDQLEELFRFKQTRKTGHDDSVAFIKLLLEAAQQRELPIYIGLTMRSDFIGDCMEFGGLPDAMNQGLCLVERMLREELRQAITGPVAVGGAAIAPRLVSRLLNDVGDDPDQLPILQHALMRTWERWREDGSPDEPVDLPHYEAIGALQEALSRHAEEAYAELDERGRILAEKLFKALTDKRTDGRGTRRPAPLSEICELTGAGEAEVAAVVERFRRPGRSFLMPPAPVPLTADSILDISHESLMRIWDRLRQWVDEEARSAQIYLGVARASERHAEGRAALWRDPELQIALSWRDSEHPTEVWARRYAPPFDQAMRFLDQSAAERGRETAEREKRRRDELRRTRILAAVLGTASLLMLSLGAFAFVQLQRAEASAQLAQAEKEKADDQAEQANKARRIALDQRRLADQERLRAEKKQQEALDQQLVAEREKANAEAQGRIAEEERLRAEAEEQIAQARAREAVAARREAEGRRSEALWEKQRADVLRTEAETSAQEARRLGQLSAARALAVQVRQPQEEARSELAALLAVGAYRLQARGGGNSEDSEINTALRTALHRLRPNEPLRISQDAVRALTLAPDGKELFIGSEDGRLQLLSLDRLRVRPVEAALFPEGSMPSGVRAVAVSPDGRLLATGGADGSLMIGSLPAGPARTLTPHTAAVSALAFQRGGPLLASAGAEGVIGLWDTARPEAPPTQLGTRNQRVTAVAWSPDGRALAAGLAQGGALLWSAGRWDAPPKTVCIGEDVRSLAFSPDGATLACGLRRGRILLQSVAGAAGGSGTPLPGHLSTVNALAFSPQGDFLASASSDATVRLWRGLRSGTPQSIMMPAGKHWIWALAVSPDGRKVIAGNERGELHVWTTRSEHLVQEICDRLRRDLTEQEWSENVPGGVEYEKTCPR